MTIVLIAPGPASSGIPNGTTAGSSFSVPSCTSSGVLGVLLSRAFSIEIAISRIRIPPPTRNEAMLMPNTRSKGSPTNIESTRTVATVKRGDCAVCLRARRSDPRSE